MVLLLALALFVAGCSEETGSGESGSTAGETEPPAETTAAPEQATSESAVSEESASEEPTSEAASGETRQEAPPPDQSSQSTGEVSALAGVEEAKRVASEWNGDVEFYSITNAQTAPVTAEGRSDGWQYSFVSPSAGEIAMVEVSNGQAQIVNAIAQPEPLIQRIAGDTLPPVDQLVDSTEAVEQAPEFKSYVEENPGARASAVLDAASAQEPGGAGEPAWFLIVPEPGLQERVSATAQ